MYICDCLLNGVRFTGRQTLIWLYIRLPAPEDMFVYYSSVGSIALWLCWHV